MRGKCRVVSWQHDDEHEQSYGNDRATPNGVIVAVVFAVVLVSVTGVGIAVALRVAGAVCAPDVLGDLIGPVTRHGQ
jgi:hypothetical protein